MNILLGLPNINERRLETAKAYIQSSIDSSSSPLNKELGLLVIKALDYDPIDINLSDLDFFRSHYANHLENTLIQLSNREEPERENLLFWLAFYLHSLQFEAVSLKNSFGKDELELGAFLETNFSSFPIEIQQRIRYLSYKLGADIANLRISTHAKKEMAGLQSEFNDIKDAVLKIEGWDSKLSTWENKVANQELRLKDQLVKLNFVGLSNAFQKLCSEKNNERIIHASICSLIGIVFLITPLIILYGYLNFQEKLPAINTPYMLGPLAAFEFSLLYFFRVALQNYASAKAQLLQLRLRLELCAFVEGYAEFIEPIREKGGVETLSKFESIVFAGISPDPQNVPSQFDGLEHLLQLVKTIRSDK